MEPQVIYSKGDRVQCLISGDQGTVMMVSDPYEEHVYVELDRHLNMPGAVSLIQKHKLRHLSAIDRLADIVND